MDSLREQITTFPAAEFWLWTLLCAGLAVLAFWLSFRYLFRARLIEDTPTALIRSAAQGYVELSGIGRWLEGPPIIAPLTGRECSWYSYGVEHRDNNWFSERSIWKPVESGVSDDLFALVDNTGLCVIDPEGAEVTAAASDRWYGATRRPPAPPLRQGWLARWLAGPGFVTGSYRYTEKRLDNGGPLYAIGYYQTVGTGYERDIKADTAALLRHWKRHPDVHLKRFDSNRDGEIDMDEWSAARAAAKEQALEQHAARVVSPVTNLLSKPVDKRQPFLLSATPQFDLVKRNKRYAAALISAFILLGGASCWLLLVRYAA